MQIKSNAKNAKLVGRRKLEAISCHLSKTYPLSQKGWPLGDFEADGYVGRWRLPLDCGWKETMEGLHENEEDRQRAGYRRDPAFLGWRSALILLW
jgi:hypothetical protein